MRAAQPSAEFVSQHVQRHNGERVGIQRGDKRHGQQGGAYHLQRAGNQTAKKSYPHATRHRATMQMPQIGTLQPMAEWFEPALAFHCFVTRQKLVEEITHDPILSVCATLCAWFSSPSASASVCGYCNNRPHYRILPGHGCCPAFRSRCSFPVS